MKLIYKNFALTLLITNLNFDYSPDYPPDFSFDFSSFEEEITEPIPELPFELPPGVNLINLEDRAQDFVLETKRIKIPGYPDAFNPSIIRFAGSLLMSFRIYHPITRATNQIGLVWLDENFNPKGEPFLLDMRIDDPFSLSKRQDPRLIAIDDKLYIVYNNSLKESSNHEIRRMLFAEVHFDGRYFFVDSSECLTQFEGENKARSQKNWVPFDFCGNLLLAYSILPHKILHPISGTGACETIASTQGLAKWEWGELRGGTPALLDGNEYLAFFHSSKSMATIHSNGKNIPHYFLGAYTFNSQPPFNITKISREPIIGDNFYRGIPYRTWKPLRVVFPGGLIIDENFVWIVYGKQDHETWMAKFDKKKLLESLIPISSD